jgi:hypothetical protein
LRVDGVYDLDRCLKINSLSGGLKIISSPPAMH